MSGLTLNKRHQICWQESKIHNCSRAVCFLSISFEKRQQWCVGSSPSCWHWGKRGSGPALVSPLSVPTNRTTADLPKNRISQPSSLYGSAAPTWEQSWPLLTGCPAQSSNGHLTGRHWFYPQRLSTRFLGKSTCLQPLKGAGPCYLGSFLSRRDIGKGAQKNWSETPLWQVTFGGHLVPSISNLPSLLDFALSSQAACPASLKRLGSGRVSIGFRGQDLGLVLLSTSVFLPVLTAAHTAEKGLDYLLATPSIPKITH